MTAGPPMNLSYAAATHVGRMRGRNTDKFILLPQQNLFVVVDGFGGEGAGAVASTIAVDALKAAFKETEDGNEIRGPCEPDRAVGRDDSRLVCAIKLANRDIFEATRDDFRLTGMGATVTGVHDSREALVVAHVGLSRVYRIRGGAIEQLTEDHSLLNDYKNLHGLIPQGDEAEPDTGILTRALGMNDCVRVDTRVEAPMAGDIVLLCSDGLSSEIPDPTILDIVTACPDPDEAVQSLIKTACDNGGADNVTVVLVRHEGAL